MAVCECGCGKEASLGQFLPGHDQKLRTSLEQQVGGLLALRSLVQAAESYVNGKMSDDNFTQHVRAIFAATRRA